VLSRAGSVDLYARNGLELVPGVGAHGPDVLLNPLHADALEVVAGRRERHRSGDVGRTGFQQAGHGFEGRVLQGDVRDHVTAPKEGGDLAPAAGTHVEAADAGRPQHLVAGEDEEVAPDVLHVHGQMGGGLRPVHQHGHAELMRERRDLLDGVLHPGHVGDVGHGHQLHLSLAGRELGLQILHVQHPAVVHLDGRGLDVAALAQQVPRDDVGVVLHLREEHDVAVLEVALGPGVGHDVRAHGGAAGEDEGPGIAGPDERGHRDPRGLVHLRGLAGQPVGTAVDVGVGGAVELLLRLDHRLGLLRRCPAVQVGQENTFVSPGFSQDWEIALDVEELRHLVALLVVAIMALLKIAKLNAITRKLILATAYYITF